MSTLRPGDENMHYCDNSHRWIPPRADIDQDDWTARVKAHLEEHRTTHGGGPPIRGTLTSRQEGLQR